MASPKTWESILPHYGLSANATSQAWRNRFSRYFPTPIPPEELLFALAFSEGEDGEPKCGAEMNDLANRLTSGCVADYCIYFSQRRDELRRGLARFGVDLLQSRDGRCQYLRTIHRLSGAMYVLFAKDVADLVRTRGWQSVSDEQLVSDQLDGRLRRFFQNEEERNGTNRDICAFFSRLADEFDSTHQWLAPEDLCRWNPALRMSVANRILARFDAVAGAEGGAGSLETFPVLRLVDGRPVYHLPETGSFPAGWRNTVAFSFGLIDGGPSVVRFRSDGGRWHRVAADFDIPFGNVLSISEHWYDEQGRQRQKDVTPSLERDFVLFDETRPDSPIVRSDSLVAGRRYLVAAIPGCGRDAPAVVRWASNDEADVVRESPTQNGRFSVPVDAETIWIEDSAWSVQSALDSWLNLSVRFGSRGGASPHGRVANASSRLFFTANDRPVIADLFPQGAQLFYRFPDGCNVRLDPDAPPPPGIEWRRGRLVCRIGSGEIRRAVTFLPTIDSGEVDEPFDSGTDKTVSIRIGDYEHRCRVDDSTKRIEFSVPGHDDIVFRFDILHRGVFVECDHSDRQPFRISVPSRIGPGVQPVLIAYEDARSSSLAVVCRDCDEEPRLAGPGMDAARSLSRRRTPMVQLLAGDKDNPMRIGDTWRIDIDSPGANSSFPFQVVLPEDIPVEGDETIVWRRQEDDLVLSFHAARVGIGRTFRLGFVPLHRLEAKPDFRDIPPDRVEFRETDRGPWLVTATLPGFFADEKIEWDDLRCFVCRLDARPDGTDQNLLCSRGFTLEVGDGLRKERDFYRTLPLGDFRLNLACSCDEEVLCLLQTEDPAERAEIEAFVFEMARNVSEFGTTADGRTAHRSFRLFSKGLAFATDWFVQAVFADGIDLSGALHSFWSPLLVRRPFDGDRRQEGESLKEDLRRFLFAQDPNGDVEILRDALAGFLSRFCRNDNLEGDRFGNLDAAQFDHFFTVFPQKLGIWRGGPLQRCFHQSRSDWLDCGRSLRDWLGQLKKIDEGPMFDLFNSARGAEGANPVPWRIFVLPDNGGEYRIPRSISELIGILARPAD